MVPGQVQPKVMTWAHPRVGPVHAGGVVGVGCSACRAVAKDGGPIVSQQALKVKLVPNTNSEITARVCSGSMMFHIIGGLCLI